jgi:hypothetical protein
MKTPHALFGKPGKSKTREDFIAAAVMPGKIKRGNGRLVVVGFCYGGGIANFLATRLPYLDAAVPFYGSAAPLEDVSKIKAELLVVLADNDERINAGWPAYDASLKAAGVAYAMLRPAGTRHGFNNSNTPRYDAGAAGEAWRLALALFERRLRGGSQRLCRPLPWDLHCGLCWRHAPCIALLIAAAPDGFGVGSVFRLGRRAAAIHGQVGFVLFTAQRAIGVGIGLIEHRLQRWNGCGLGLGEVAVFVGVEIVPGFLGRLATALRRRARGLAGGRLGLIGSRCGRLGEGRRGRKCGREGQHAHQTKVDTLFHVSILRSCMKEPSVRSSRPDHSDTMQITS